MRYSGDALEHMVAREHDFRCLVIEADMRHMVARRFDDLEAVASAAEDVAIFQIGHGVAALYGGKVGREYARGWRCDSAHRVTASTMGKTCCSAAYS